MTTPDLSTTYLDLHLDSPLVPSASPLGRDLDGLRRMEDAGAAAVVLPSLFEEQIVRESHELDYFLDHGTYSYAEALTFFPEPPAYALSPDKYLEHVAKAKAHLGIPVIASLNGTSNGGWLSFAQRIEQAGADALELNVYSIPTNPALQGSVIEHEIMELVRAVRQAVRIPIAVKLSPYFTNLAMVARGLEAAGANGLVLFNRFQQPDIDLESLELVARPSLSHPEDDQSLRLPLCWIGILSGQVHVSLAASSGVHSASDVVKLLLVGADVTMLASELLLRGIDRLTAIRADLVSWLVEHEDPSVASLRGSLSQRFVTFPETFERAQYVRAVSALP